MKSVLRFIIRIIFFGLFVLRGVVAIALALLGVFGLRESSWQVPDTSRAMPGPSGTAYLGTTAWKTVTDTGGVLISLVVLALAFLIGAAFMRGIDDLFDGFDSIFDKGPEGGPTRAYILGVWLCVLFAIPMAMLLLGLTTGNIDGIGETVLNIAFLVVVAIGLAFV